MRSWVWLLVLVVVAVVFFVSGSAVAFFAVDALTSNYPLYTCISRVANGFEYPQAPSDVAWIEEWCVNRTLGGVVLG